MRFLEAAIRRNRRRLNLEDLLHLLLRCALLLFVALAMARPAVHSPIASVFGQARVTAAIVIDSSESMALTDGNQSRFAIAKLLAKQAIDSFPSRSEVAIYAASDISQALIAEPTHDLFLARRTVDNALRTDRPTNLYPAIEQAMDVLKGSASDRRELYIITDGQALGLRQFLMNVPLPHFTEADCYTKGFTIATGDSATVGAFSHRLTPRAGVVEVRYASGQKAIFPAERMAGAGPPKFSHTIQAVQEPFDYRIHLGDGVTPYYRVDVQPPPALVSLNCQQVWPAYADQPDQALTAGNLTMLQGSKLRIRIKSSKPLMRLGESENISRVHFAGSESEAALSVDPSDPTVATVEAQVANTSTGLSIRLIDQAGLNSRDPVVYPLQLVPDQPPTVTLTFPERKDELATAAAKFTIGFHAADDVGVAAITLKYQLDNGPVRSVPIDIQPILKKQGSALDIKGRYVWDLSQLTPTAAHPHLLGTAINYWVEAADGSNTTGARGSVGGDSAFAGLPPRDRQAITQSESEKVLEEYSQMIQQYMQNLAEGNKK